MTCVAWLITGPIICGLCDGKVRALQVKSNKSHSLYATDSLVVSLSSNPRGTGFISGHVDGSVIRFFVVSDDVSQDTNGKVFIHPVPPCAMSWLQDEIVVGGCDKRVAFYGQLGKLVKQFDYSKDPTEREFTVACSSPSGQVLVTLSVNEVLDKSNYVKCCSITFVVKDYCN